MFISSFQVFKPSKKLHWLFLILRSYDFSSLSKSLYSEFYSQKKSKNHSYDPSSMLRLLFFIREYLPKHTFDSRHNKLDEFHDFLLLCGFSDNIPSYSTFHYFTHRLKQDKILFLLNKIRVIFSKSLFKSFIDRFHSKFVVFAIDSKPVGIYGNNLPIGTIHSHNKSLNGKLGIKIHHISIVYPFYMPLVFAFSPGHHNDSPFFRSLLPQISDIIHLFNSHGINTFITADKGYDSFDNRALATSLDVIPVIMPKDNSHNLSDIFYEEGDMFCTFSPKRFHHDGFDYKKNRFQFRCYDKSCTRVCPRRFKFRSPKDFQLSLQVFLIHKLRLEITSKDFFSTIYSYRKEIEIIHAIWSNALGLKNIIYCKNIKKLWALEFSIIDFSSKHFLLNSSMSPLKYFKVLI